MGRRKKGATTAAKVHPEPVELGEMPSAFPDEQPVEEASIGGRGRLAQVGLDDTTAFRDSEEGLPDMSKTFGLSDDVNDGETPPSDGPEEPGQDIESLSKFMGLMDPPEGDEAEEAEPEEDQEAEAPDAEGEDQGEAPEEEAPNSDQDYLFRMAVERGVPPGRAKVLLEKGVLGDFLDALQETKGAKAPDATPGGEEPDSDDDPVGKIADLGEDFDEDVQNGWKAMKGTLRDLHRENQQLKEQVTLLAGHVNETVQERAVRDMDEAVSSFGDAKALGETGYFDLKEGSPQQKRRVEIANKANLLWQAYEKEGVTPTRKQVFKEAIRLLGYEKKAASSGNGVSPRQPTRMNRPQHREELPQHGEDRAREIIRQGLAKLRG